MVRKQIIWIAFLYLFNVIPNNAYAGCDPCVQGAVEGTTASLEAVLKVDKQSVEASIQAADALKQSIESYNTTITNATEYNTTMLESAIDAMKKRVSGSMSKLSKAEANLIDHYINNLVVAYNEDYLLRKNHFESLEFGDNSKPKSTTVALASSIRVSDGRNLQDTLYATMLEDMDKWMLSGNMHENGLMTAKRSEIMDPNNQNITWDPSELIINDEVTAESSAKLQSLLKILVQPEPIRLPSEVRTDNELNQYYKGLMKANDSQIAFSVLADALVKKTETINISDQDWGIYYTTADRDKNNKASSQSYLKSETIGKLTSPEWHLNVSTLTNTGLLKELLIQQSMKNKMLLELIELESKKALLASMKLRKEYNQ